MRKVEILGVGVIDNGMVVYLSLLKMRSTHNAADIDYKTDLALCSEKLIPSVKVWDLRPN